MLEAKREELRRLQKELAKVQGKIEQMRTIQPARMDKLKVWYRMIQMWEFVAWQEVNTDCLHTTDHR